MRTRKSLVVLLASVLAAPAASFAWPGQNPGARPERRDGASAAMGGTRARLTGGTPLSAAGRPGAGALAGGARTARPSTVTLQRAGDRRRETSVVRLRATQSLARGRAALTAAQALRGRMAGTAAQALRGRMAGTAAQALRGRMAGTRPSSLRGPRTTPTDRARGATQALSVRDLQGAAASREPAQDLQRVGVIADMDGTLADTEPDLRQAVGIAFRELGVELPPERLNNLAAGAPLETIVRAVIPNATEHQMNRFIGAWVRGFANLQNRQARAYPSTAPALRAIRAIDPRIPFGIATAQEPTVARSVIGHVGLGSWFKSGTVIGTGDRKLPSKPDPTSLHVAAANAGLRPGDKIFYVGDSPNDIRAAHNAGFIAVAVRSENHGYGDAKEIADARPDHWIRDMSELPSLVAREYAQRAPVNPNATPWRLPDRVVTPRPARAPAPPSAQPSRERARPNAPASATP